MPKDKDKASLTPLLSRIPRHRSYSIQVPVTVDQLTLIAVNRLALIISQAVS